MENIQNYINSVKDEDIKNGLQLLYNEYNKKQTNNRNRQKRYYTNRIKINHDMTEEQKQINELRRLKRNEYYRNKYQLKKNNT